MASSLSHFSLSTKKFLMSSSHLGLTVSVAGSIALLALSITSFFIIGDKGFFVVFAFVIAFFVLLITGSKGLAFVVFAITAFTSSIFSIADFALLISSIASSVRLAVFGFFIYCNRLFLVPNDSVSIIFAMFHNTLGFDIMDHAALHRKAPTMTFHIHSGLVGSNCHHDHATDHRVDCIAYCLRLLDTDFVSIHLSIVFATAVSLFNHLILTSQFVAVSTASSMKFFILFLSLAPASANALSPTSQDFLYILTNSSISSLLLCTCESDRVPLDAASLSAFISVMSTALNHALAFTESAFLATIVIAFSTSIFLPIGHSIDDTSSITDFTVLLAALAISLSADIAHCSDFHAIHLSKAHLHRDHTSP